MLTPEQLLDGFGSYLVEQAYIMCLRRRCEEALEELAGELSRRERRELEGEYALLSNTLERVNSLYIAQGYQEQE